MNILVTGNMGYIGPSVVKQLRASYPEAVISGLDMGYFAGCLSSPNSVLPECLLDRQWFADVRRMPDEALLGVDAVIHLAGISNDPIGNAFESVTYEINHLATVELAKKARAAGVRSFVYASSCSMYGFADDGPRMEISPLNPLTAYAKSKVYSEQRMSGLANDEFTVTSLRFATACGMSERLRLDLVLNDFVACALTTGKITVLSDGTPWRPLINIKDMARAIDWAAGRGADDGIPPYLAVNVGSDEWNYRVSELAAAVADRIPGVEVSINENAQPDRRSYRVNFELFRKVAPNHQPVFSLDATINELIEGLRAIDFSETDFRNSRSYIRLNTLKEMREHGLLSDGLEWMGQGAMEAVR
ncbi:MAG: SDR family oxidoreductase [Nitrospiraceae bacterium]|nr:SDR family oxidoreductase [Nitrospiraceae bacterium]